MPTFNVVFDPAISIINDTKFVLGVAVRDYRSSGLNQVNGLPLSLAPGLYEYQEQFAQMGLVDLRAHDLFGVADIDSYYNSSSPRFDDQVTNNAPADRKSGIKTFLDDFVNRRTLVSNISDVYNRGASPVYNWAPTDSYLIRAMKNPFYNGARRPNILFRLGRLINGGAVAPANFNTYANIVRSVVNRYTVNYAQTGLPYPVLEYEIWNEPDLGSFWYAPGEQTPDATSRQYYEFYATVARAIKEVAPNALVGGPGVAGANGSREYVDNFIRYIAENSVPMDFYSLHIYPIDAPDRRGIIGPTNYVKSVLNNNSLNAKLYITEWNCTAFASQENNTKVQSLFNASFITYFLLNLENEGLVDKAYYYRGDSAEFGLFNNETPVTPAAQALWLYNQLVTNRNRTLRVLSVDIDGNSLTGNDASSIFTTAGIDSQNRTIKILAVRYAPNPNLTNYNARNTLPAGTSLKRQHYVDNSRPASDLSGSNEYYGGNTNATNSNEYYYGVAQVPSRNNNLFYQLPPPAGLNTSNDFTGASNTLNPDRLSISIRDLNITTGTYTVSVQRITGASQLNSLEIAPEAIVHNQPITNRSLSFTDDYSLYGDYSVHLYTIEFSG
ncbi:UNVERIFIED_CONTAM: glycosyl hydrolase [Pseudomonas aeruginosa]